MPVARAEVDTELLQRVHVPRLNTFRGSETSVLILVRVQRGRSGLEAVLKDVLGLTKFNFNCCRNNKRLPVTIRFASAVGNVLIAAPIEWNLYMFQVMQRHRLHEETSDAIRLEANCRAGHPGPEPPGGPDHAAAVQSGLGWSLRIHCATASG